MPRQMRDPLDREERLQHAREYLAALGLKHYRAVVFGSVARGDFVAESDTDLLIISNDLPEPLRERLALLFGSIDKAPEIEPIGWRESEWERRTRLGDHFIGVLEREGLELDCSGR